MCLRPPLLVLAVLCLMWPGALSAQGLPFGISLPPSLNFATSPSPVGSGARVQGKALAFSGIFPCYIVPIVLAKPILIRACADATWRSRYGRYPGYHRQ